MEEKLIADIKSMFKDIKKEDEFEKYLHFSLKYSPPVKISDWFLHLEAEPKDNNPYCPPGGNYFVSTYQRLGSDTTHLWETTTQTMLRQVCNKQPYINLYRSMVPAQSVHLLRPDMTIHPRRQVFQEVPLLTSYREHFREPYVHRSNKHKSESPCENRFGLKPILTSTKICETKFLDDWLIMKTKHPSN